MRLLALWAVAVATVLSAAGTAHADDPTPAPGPYQIIGPNGPVLGGLPTYPTVCAVQPRACNLTWNPSTGAWDAPPGT
jgi:hypothetical protein